MTHKCPNCGQPSLNNEKGNDCGRDRCAALIAKLERLGHKP